MRRSIRHFTQKNVSMQKTTTYIDLLYEDKIMTHAHLYYQIIILNMVSKLAYQMKSIAARCFYKISGSFRHCTVVRRTEKFAKRQIRHAFINNFI
uniref:Uncharacterized protein n=1 Tax=Arundo donax TaxID=35708 RepID=A0A0A9EPA8_ARUDO